MTGKERFHAAMAGLKTDCVAVMPKMWVDVAAHVMGLELADVLGGDPARVTAVVVDAAKRLGADGARLLLFPRRAMATAPDGALLHLDDRGRVLGTIDTQGGWKTLLAGDGAFELENPDHMAHYHCWQARGKLVKNADDIRRIAVPKASYYEGAGYGAAVQTCLASAGESLGLAGDCNSGTLALLVAMRGMSDALTDLYDDPVLAHAMMDKGIEMSLERARFFVGHGVRVLRYNDSVANMSVISPACFREFVLPHLMDFCAEAHRLAPDVRVYCHICGNTLPILGDLAKSGLDSIAPLDPMGGFTLAEARQAAGSPIVLMGGVNTMSFLRSTPQEIREEALACIRQGSAGGGYILGSGCALPPGTRLENLAAFVDAAHAAC